MRTRNLPWLALLVGLTLASTAARAADKPTILLRVSSIDSLLADMRYLVELAGKGEEAKQFEGVLKAFTGPKGLEGIDTTKPMGLYAKVGPNGIDSEAVVLLPIADEKAFVDLLERLNIKAEKNKEGVYSANVERVPFPIHFRFANGYVYATVREESAIAKNRLLAPATVLPEGQIGTLSLVLNLDQLPDELKRMAIGQTALQLANLKEQKMPGESEAQHQFRVAVLDQVGGDIKSLLNDGGEMLLGLSLDRKTADLSASFRMTAKEGSELARRFAELGKGQSMAAGLITSQSAMNLVVNAILPDKLRQALAPVIDDGVKKALDDEKDQAKRELLSTILKAVTPTLKSGELDVAFDLRGSGTGTPYTLLAGVKVKDGKSLDVALRNVIKELPKTESAAVTPDVAKVGDVSIHRITPPNLDEQAKKLLGDQPVYYAFRDDALLVAAGASGLDALKEAIQATPKAGQTMRLELSLARMAPLMTKEHPSAPAAAKKAFTQEGSDKIVLTLQGGVAIQAKASLKAQIVTFFSLLDQADKKDK
jgi:hypothetical protein